MQRIFGMMPSNEIEKVGYFKDKLDLMITIEAGPHGWTIMYADHSAKYADKNASSEDNFNEAKSIAESELGTLKEMNMTDDKEEAIGEC